MKRTHVAMALLLPGAALAHAGEPQGKRGFIPGKGYGWIWGEADEVGSLNMMTDASRLAALRLELR